MGKPYKGVFSNFENPKKYVGDITKCVYRSSWERNAFRWCDRNKTIESWASEEIAIPYFNPVKNKVAKYYPDLFIRFTDGTVKIVEIKPAHQTSLPKQKRKTQKYLNEMQTYMMNNAKWEAANKFCEKNSIIFEIWTEDTLQKLGITRMKVTDKVLLAESKRYQLTRAKPKHKVSKRPKRRS